MADEQSANFENGGAKEENKDSFQNPENPSIIQEKVIDGSRRYKQWELQREEIKKYRSVDKTSQSGSTSTTPQRNKTESTESKESIDFHNTSTEDTQREIFLFRTITQLAETLIFEGYFRILIVFPDKNAFVPSQGLLIPDKMKNWCRYSHENFLKEFIGLKHDVEQHDTAEKHQNREQEQIMNLKDSKNMKSKPQVKKILLGRKLPQHKLLKEKLKEVPEKVHTPKPDPQTYYPFVSEEFAPSRDLPWIDCITMEQYIDIRLYNKSLLKERYSVIIIDVNTLLKKSLIMETVLKTIRFDVEGNEGAIHDDALLSEILIIFFLNDLSDISPMQNRWISTLNHYFNNCFCLYRQFTDNDEAQNSLQVIYTKSTLKRSIETFRYQATDLYESTTMMELKKLLITSILKIYLQSSNAHILVFMPSNDLSYMMDVEHQISIHLSKDLKDFSLQKKPLLFLYVTPQSNLEDDLEICKKLSVSRCIFVSKCMEDYVPPFDNVQFVIDTGYRLSTQYLRKYTTYTYNFVYETVERSQYRSSFLQYPNAKSIRLFHPSSESQFDKYEMPEALTSDLFRIVLTHVFLYGLERPNHSLFPFSKGFESRYDEALHNATEKLIRLKCIEVDDFEDIPKTTTLGELILHLNVPIEIGRMLILSEAFNCEEECCFLAAMLLTMEEYSLFSGEKSLRNCDSHLQDPTSDHYTLYQILQEFEKQSTLGNAKKWCKYRSMNNQCLTQALKKKQELYNLLKYVQGIMTMKLNFSTLGFSIQSQLSDTNSLNVDQNFNSISNSIPSNSSPESKLQGCSVSQSSKKNDFLLSVLQGFILNVASFHALTQTWHLYTSFEEIHVSQDSAIPTELLGTTTKQFVVFHSITPNREMRIISLIPNEEWLQETLPEKYYSILSEI